MAVLAGDYYAECHKIFRQATNQQQLMLMEIRQMYQKAASLIILSVGSGVGLFELPMLDLLLTQGVRIKKFVGNDIDRYACDVLSQKLDYKYEKKLDYEVVATSFEKFDSTDRFDLILFNHVFEYLPKNHLMWLKKAQGLLADKGCVIIFSPNKPGINKIYSETFHQLHGYSPFFTAGVKEILDLNNIFYKSKEILAECDISLLRENEKHPEKLMLLSFLVQMDCRKMTLEKQNEYRDYFLSLRPFGKVTIPHPTTMFII